MSASVVVLVEEPSARIVIDELCKTLMFDRMVQVLEHQGKRDLEKSVARKINGWRSEGPTYFIVSRDLDNANRADLKARLVALVPQHALQRTKIRIVIPELEAWYLGDPQAILAAGLIKSPSAARINGKARLRDLCLLSNAKREFQTLVGPIGQIRAAREIAPFLSPDRNRSLNFKAFVAALRWAVASSNGAARGTV